MLTLSRYWGKPEATAAAVVALPGLGGGWLRTGDVATIDGDGALAIVDRMKDIIIRGELLTLPPHTRPPRPSRRHASSHRPIASS